MSEPISAIFDAGVFRPLQPVDLPNGARAEVTLITPSATTANQWPVGYFEQTSGALTGEQLERPTQGELPQRDQW